MRSDSPIPYSNRRFVERLLTEIPEFRPVYDEHMRDQQGELLPHVLMGDFVQFLVEAPRQSIGEKTSGRSGRAIIDRAM